MNKGPAQTASARSRGKRPLILLLLYGILGGGTFSASKIAVTAGVPPIDYAVWQLIGAGLVMAALAAWRRLPVSLSGEHLRFYVVCGVGGIALPAVVMFSAIRHLPAGAMALIASTIPIFTYGIACLLRLEAQSGRRLAGIFLGMSGAVVLVAPQMGSGDAASVGWAVIALLVPMGYACGSTYTGARRPEESSPIALTVGMVAAAGAALTPVAIADGEFYVPRLPLDPADIAIVAQMLISGIGYLLFFEIIRTAGAIYFSQVGYVVTLSGASWAALTLDEMPSHTLIIASVLVFTALWLVRPRAMAWRAEREH